jgi:hygromycin-B 7''-O-kinase
MAEMGQSRRLHRWNETVALYRLYYVLEFWCWMALLGNAETLAGLTRDMEREVAS